MLHGCLRGGWGGDAGVCAAAAEPMEELCSASDPLPGRVSTKAREPSSPSVPVHACSRRTAHAYGLYRYKRVRKSTLNRECYE